MLDEAEYTNNLISQKQTQLSYFLIEIKEFI